MFLQFLFLCMSFEMAKIAALYNIHMYSHYSDSPVQTATLEFHINHSNNKVIQPLYQAIFSILYAHVYAQCVAISCILTEHEISEKCSDTCHCNQMCTGALYFGLDMLGFVQVNSKSAWKSQLM